MKILYYQLQGATVRFIYFTGTEYNTVSAENYSGLSDFVRMSGAQHLNVADIYDKVNELNAPIRASKAKCDEICLRIKEDEEYVPSIVQWKRHEDGICYLAFADDITPNDEMRRLYPEIK